MRSKLVFQALAQVRNPFQLCQLASKASRGFYRTTMVSSPHAINQAFEMVARGSLRTSLPLRRLSLPTWPREPVLCSNGIMPLQALSSTLCIFDQ
jgi:hypothetical protein